MEEEKITSVPVNSSHIRMAKLKASVARERRPLDRSSGGMYGTVPKDCVLTCVQFKSRMRDSPKSASLQPFHRLLRLDMSHGDANGADSRTNPLSQNVSMPATPCD